MIRKRLRQMGASPIPAPPPAPTNEAAQQGEQPTQTVTEGPPTHVIWREDGPEYVHPEGYAATDIEALPAGFWDAPMVGDPAKKTFSADLDRARSDKKAEIASAMDAAFLAGYPAAIGALAGQRLQVRDNDDRTNWLTSQAAYSAQVDAGNGDVAGAEFRTASNETITLTFAEGLRELLGMAAWAATIMATSWKLKDALASDDDINAIMALDVAAAPWPS
jgi:hypothetical protein